MNGNLHNAKFPSIRHRTDVKVYKIYSILAPTYDLFISVNVVALLDNI